MKMPKFVLAAFFTFLAATSAFATIDASLQMQLGNASSATADPANHAHFLIQRPQYALDYNDTTHEPNWVAWDLTSGDVGSSGRGDFQVDTTLPVGFYEVLTTDYSGSGYDRGHMCPSADRTVTVADNEQLFYMSNMIPQAPDNNQGVWANFESYCRSLASAGNEILITSGPSVFGGSTLVSGVAIPGYTWKIAVVVPLGPGTALSRITSSTRIITVKIPNIAGVRSTPWENFVTSVAQIEADTGYTFLTALPGPVASALRTVVDGQSAAGSPTVTTQPSPQTTVVGGSASFSVTATGNATLTYQWSHDDNEIPGATAATLTIPSVQASDVGNYFVVVSNSVGSTTSNAAALVVTGLPPAITTPPASATVSAGAGITLAVSVTGSPTLTYQWRKNTTPIGGATNATLSLFNLQSGDAGNYDVVVTNSVNSVTSAPATLTVNPAAPTITGQPASRTASTGDTASFTVVASGTNPLSYLWRKNTVPMSDGGIVSGSTTATLLLTGVSGADSASYDVVVTNTLNSATSTAATLTVNPPPPSTVFWDFGPTATPTANPTSGLTADITGGTVTQGNNNGTTPLLSTTSASTPTSTFSGANNVGAAARIGALNKAASGSAYFEFTLAPSAGKRLLATGFSFGTRSTATGPQAYSVFSSLDSFTTAVATGTLPVDTNWHLITTSFTTQTGTTGAPITFRIFGFNGAGSPQASTANWRLDDLRLTVNAVFPPPVAPAVTATTPVNGATSVPIFTPITVTFNEAVAFTGSWFSISSAANGPMAATVTGGPTTFTLAPPSNFANTDTITVTIFGAQVVDQASGSIHGASNTTFSFTTEVFVPPTAPTVTTQPAPVTVNVGSNASFTVAASGTPNLSYQWRKGGTPISGNSSAATPTLTLTAVTTGDAGSYDCVVSNVAGSDVSHPAVLTVNLLPPSITTPPAGQMVTAGSSATFTVVAGGTGPFTYQWRKNGTPLTDGGVVSGSQLVTLTLTGVAIADSGAYDVIVTNALTSVTSSAATLAVTSATPAVIYWDFTTASPTSGIPTGVTGGVVTQANNNGTTPLLTTTSASGTYAGASGGNNVGAAARTGALNQGTAGSAYFEFTFTPDAGRQFAASAINFGMRSTSTGPQAYAIFTSADNFTTPIANGPVLNDALWHLITPTFSGVTGATGSAVTFRLFGYSGTGSPGASTANWRMDDVKLTAGLLAVPLPVITTQPIAQVATAGDNVTFSTAATGVGTLSYQWRKGGLPISGNASATTNVLTLNSVTTSDAGGYDCLVTNGGGSIATDTVALTVNKRATTPALSLLQQTYDGAAKSATITTVPAGLGVTVTYNGSATIPTAPGTYAVVATINDPSYTGTVSGTLVITTTALVRHAPTLNGGLDGSIQVMLPESTTLATTAWVSGDLLVPGTPTVTASPTATYGGTIDGTGLATPSTYTVSLNGNSVLRHVVRRTDAVDMPTVTAPPLPTGTRVVSLTAAGQSPGDFTTLKNLTLNANAGPVAVPPGTYGVLSANGNSSLVLGVVGSTEPAIYNLQGLTLNTLVGAAQLQIVGPVIITVAGAPLLSGDSGSSAHPEWLTIRVSGGGLSVTGVHTLNGKVLAPTGTVTLNANSTLNGTVTADKLTINGNAVLNDPNL